MNKVAPCQHAALRLVHPSFFGLSFSLLARFFLRKHSFLLIVIFFVLPLTHFCVRAPSPHHHHLAGIMRKVVRQVVAGADDKLVACTFSWNRAAWNSNELEGSVPAGYAGPLLLLPSVVSDWRQKFLHIKQMLVTLSCLTNYLSKIMKCKKIQGNIFPSYFSPFFWGGGRGYAAILYDEVLAPVCCCGTAPKLTFTADVCVSLL